MKQTKQEKLKMSNELLRQKVRICHLSSVHGQEDTRIFHKECVSLANAGYEVYEITQGKTYIKHGVYIIGIRSIGTGRFDRMFRTTKNVYSKALEIDADIYHAHDPELLPTLLKLKKKGKIVVFDSHEYTVGAIEEKMYIPKVIRWLVKKIYESYQQYACRSLDAIVTATPNITDYFKNIGCKRVIDLCNFPILSGKLIEPDYHSRIIAFAGGISKQWNHEHILNALIKINNIKYILCGSADMDYLELLKTNDGWDKVVYKGHIPFEQVSVVLQCSAVGLALLTASSNTDWENGNMANTKIFEEMMAGLPIICTNFNRWRKFVTEYDCGICVNPHDEVEIADAIKELIDNPNTAKVKGLNGRRAVEEKFNWGTQERKLILLYRELEKELEGGKK